MIPAWLMGLGATGQGIQQALQRQQDQKNRQQMIQALLGRRNQQNPGGFGATPAAFGPQNWGAQNQNVGGVIHDQWGNPIGPAGQSAQGQGPGASPAAAAPTVSPDIWQGAGGSDPSSLAGSMTAGMPAAAPIPGLGGPSQAAPTGGVPGFSGQPAGYGASPDPTLDPTMMALFSQQFGP